MSATVWTVPLSFDHRDGQKHKQQKSVMLMRDYVILLSNFISVILGRKVIKNLNHGNYKLLKFIKYVFSAT